MDCSINPNLIVKVSASKMTIYDKYIVSHSRRDKGPVHLP